MKNYNLKCKVTSIKFNVKRFLLGIRYWFILKLIGKIPVIVNCTIYDDIMEYNFGKTRTYKPCVCFNNKVRNFSKVMGKEVALRLKELKLDKVQRKGNFFVLDLNK